MATLLLEAYESWQFKDSKPFVQGTDTRSGTLFPPLPSTIYGALRGLYLHQHPAEFVNANTDQDPAIKAKFKVKGIWLTQRKFPNAPDASVTFLVPLPAYILAELNATAGNLRFHKLKLDTKRYIGTNKQKNLYQLYSENQNKELIDSSSIYITWGSFINLIERNNLYLKHANYFPIRWNHTGHGGDPALGTVDYKNGKLYTSAMVKMHDEKEQIGILASTENLEFNLDDTFPFAGDGQTAIVSAPPTNTELPKLSTHDFQADPNAVYVIYLATPGIFKDGGAPIEIFEKMGLTYLCMAMRRPGYFSGFDMVAKKPKCGYKMVPAGTTYFVKINSNTFDISKIQNQCISDIMPEQGFGLAYFYKHMA